MKNLFFCDGRKINKVSLFVVTCSFFSIYPMDNNNSSIATVWHQDHLSDDSAGEVQSISWSPDDLKIISTQLGNGITIWDVLTKKNEHHDCDNQQVEMAKYSNDGNKVMVYLGDSIEIFDARTWQRIQKPLTIPSGYSATDALWSPDDSSILCYDATHPVQHFLINLNIPKISFYKGEDEKKSFGWKSDGTCIYFVSEGRSVIEKNLQTDQEKMIYDFSKAEFPHGVCFSFNAECSKIATMLSDNEFKNVVVALYDIQHKKELFSKRDTYQACGIGNPLSLSEKDIIACGSWSAARFWDSQDSVSIKYEKPAEAPTDGASAWNHQGLIFAKGDSSKNIITLFKHASIEDHDHLQNNVPVSQPSICSLQ